MEEVEVFSDHTSSSHNPVIIGLNKFELDLRPVDEESEREEYEGSNGVGVENKDKMVHSSVHGCFT